MTNQMTATGRQAEDHTRRAKCEREVPARLFRESGQEQRCGQDIGLSCCEGCMQRQGRVARCDALVCMCVSMCGVVATAESSGKASVTAWCQAEACTANGTGTLTSTLTRSHAHTRAQYQVSGRVRPYNTGLRGIVLESADEPQCRLGMSQNPNSQ